MDSKEWSKQEYTARIYRVMDYIGQNIGKAIDLNTMAAIAAFSPYHFHRIFTFMVGETPNQFVNRIKLEKAAQQLLDYPQKSISDIAFSCGFSSLSAFSRVFRGYFGTTALKFRTMEKGIYIQEGMRYDKNCKMVSKIGQKNQLPNTQLCSVKLKLLIIMDTQIEIKQMPELNLIYCRHTGAFNQIGVAYEKLFRWAGPRGLVIPTAKTVTVYRDDPGITSIEKVRQDASLIVEKGVKVEGEIGKSTVPAGKYAVGHFEIKETEFEKAWSTMCAWLTESGYQPGDGWTYELYHNDYNEYPEHKFIVDICIPVKQL